MGKRMVQEAFSEDFPNFENFLKFLSGGCEYLETCAPEDRNFKIVVRRYNSSDEIREYKLNTVTYGLSSSLFLATKCLKEISINSDDDPAITKISEEDVYMDDVISGFGTAVEALFVCKRLSSLLHADSFDLRKWLSNFCELSDEIKEHCSQETNFEITTNETAKVLGMVWNSVNNIFNFKVTLNLLPPFTKRRILSESARILDPLGNLSPCTLWIKIIYPKLLFDKGDWDFPISSHLLNGWIKFQEAFPDGVIQFHGFADASSLLTPLPFIVAKCTGVQLL
ncbi:hypothetical protein AVEN_154451-1 [Araneus ventricosus]|uniref:Uncharacterized protein n=1 Tax=Araneus ventricosus TaxID=182803 RepID=A0A4Y2JYD1_ARAVE|nr:hypothetical protein AVEN_154451-1 [Araneus ventricosus]